ncbi:ABC transporter permease [Patescibacteria group bacterium]|nr:ABC transporter permease [Patescibacteria group bacterium]
MQNGYLHLAKAALADFKRNKVRTLLTSLGIMIGVLSVVMLIALGLGLKNYLKQTFENLGANLVMVMPGSGFGGGGMSPAGLMGGIEFDERDVNSLSRIANVKYTVPLFFKSTTIETGSNEESAYVMGVNTDHFKLMDAELVAGEYFDDSDVQARAKVAVLGYNIADKLFEEVEGAVGKTIRFSDQRFKVVGVVEKTGDNEQDNSVIIPYKTTYGSMNPDKTFWAIYIGVESEDDVSVVQEKVEETLLKRYKEDEFSVTEQSELLSTINQIFNILNGVLVAIGSISLVVGGIGIMNIMYATVTERIKEVGIIRAVGATEADILRQFLTESVLLSVFGGVLGLLLAGLIVLVVHPFFPVAINLFSVIITFVISSGIGIFFGVFPARRAAKLPPIEAIRYE